MWLSHPLASMDCCLPINTVLNKVSQSKLGITHNYNEYCMISTYIQFYRCLSKKNPKNKTLYVIKFIHKLIIIVSPLRGNSITLGTNMR